MMNISKRSRKVFEDNDEHMNKNKKIHHDIVYSSHIPEDLTVEILLRLPPISAHRFRRVCKHWHSLISNPEFLRTHSSSFPLHNTTHGHQLLVFSNSRGFQIGHRLPLFSNSGDVNIFPRLECVPLTQFEQVENYRKPPPPLRKLLLDLSTNLVHYDLIDSCNGLFLLHSLGTYYTCNPVTKHYFKLPDIPFRKVDGQNLIHHSRQARLVFDPSISLSYKVIKYLPKTFNYQYCQIYVYSSETGSWRLSDTKIHDLAIIQKFNLPSVMLNGVLYWSYSTTAEDVSICFDVEKECVWFLSLPLKPRNSVRNCLYFGKSEGCLRLIERFDNVYHALRSFDIMETEPKQQHNGVHCIWNVKYHVNVSRIFRCIRNNHASVIHCYKICKERASVIHCYKMKNRRGNEEDVLLLRLNGRFIVSFNLTGKKIMKEIANYGRPWIHDLTDVFTYTPTLFPVS